MENKTSKYLKYAIGEIILVVIGILIAIQANNWNVDRMAQKEKEFALNKLVENLKQDINNLKDGIAGGRYYITALDSCLIMLKTPEVYSKDRFSRLYAYLGYTIPFEYNQITFNEMSNSGKLQLINNKVLIDSLFHYYGDSSFKSTSDALIFYTRNNTSSFTMDYDFMVLPNEFDNHTASEFNIVQKSLVDYSSEVRVINAIRFKILILKSLTNSYDNLVNSASNLISLINQELSNE